MSTWILIIMLTGGNGKALDHINFDTEKLCKKAALQFKKEISWRSSIATICVESKHD